MGAANNKKSYFVGIFLISITIWFIIACCQSWEIISETKYDFKEVDFPNHKAQMFSCQGNNYNLTSITGKWFNETNLEIYEIEYERTYYGISFYDLNKYFYLKNKQTNEKIYFRANK